MTEMTPFELDIAEQPAALRRLAEADLPQLEAITGRPWDRIVLTGMGSSDYVGIPTWRTLTALGLPALIIDSGQLLDNPGAITPDTLLIATSQSGASGEVVELLNRRDAGAIAPAALLGIADPADSPLAEASDVFLPLQSGPEATVSTKSYLNSMAVHRLLAAAFAGEPAERVREDIAGMARITEQLITGVDVKDIAAATALHPQRRLVFVGRGDESATSLFSALITKESSKVPAEGFIGGQFRHGPFELAGDGLTAVLYGMRQDTPDESLRRLATDLVATGSQVVLVGDEQIPGALTVRANGTSPLSHLAASSVVAELLAVNLAQANGVVPGEFRYGSKITTAI
ncbi:MULTISPECIES: SIS domain-containing protein [Arthrobacter]|uniref:Glutamine--fructose-6-phosphate aminotransferase [isomerizing] n=1 Tax=Arthrobacter terricola TaxID=2547396 RepID=A0A4R5KHT7_9MICC|nr:MULTISPECIES: SIS domain-containing protein [Arthrobacter]MBT8161943.1 SIS domain-containing protein [Arthrobacter sp. GN70]TDF94318.1 SIS domain-containing protein [Arthrobacter terricola]